tara:strand:- start:814 stop:1851 length:1038 start_codon:yes stop_codon:yes gene_type:complete
MSTNQQNKEEEEDLGSLFVIIGNGFKKLFNFIGSIFKGLFHFLILILLFFKSHFLKFLIAAVIGGVVGAFLENVKEDKFGSNLLVQPNFNSTRQLYKNVNYYNDLVKQKKIKLLSSTFNIDTTKALKLREFDINPVINNNDIINSYNEFILSVDTLTVKSYAFSQFKRDFTDYDYSIHEIHVNATDNSIFIGLGEVIIASVVKNDYFKRLQKLTNENLSTTDSLLRKNLVQVDSLRQLYMRVMLQESKKESSATSIDLGGTKNTTKEIELFDTDRKIISELKRTSQDIAQQSEVINIVSNFQTVGYQINRISRNYIFLLSAFAVLLLTFFILLLELNKYLNNYKK